MNLYRSNEEINVQFRKRLIDLTDPVRCPFFEDCCNVDLKTGCCSFLIDDSSNAALVSPIKFNNGSRVDFLEQFDLPSVDVFKWLNGLIKTGVGGVLCV